MKSIQLDASAAVPPTPGGVVLVGYGGPEHRRNAVALADLLHHSGLATLVADLLTRDESDASAALEPERLAHRVTVGLDWIGADPRTRELPVGFLADARCASALLVACAHEAETVMAAACLGGLPDEAGAALGRVRAPVLFVAGEYDAAALGAARRAQGALSISELAVIQHTVDVAREPAGFHAAAHRIRDWFLEHLAAPVH